MNQDHVHAPQQISRFHLTVMTGIFFSILFLAGVLSFAPYSLM